LSRRESLKELTGFSKRLDFVYLYAQRKLVFVQRLLQHFGNLC